ncbi:hypothetical protein I317_03282 [Kwoniella heveanensis CBS 569]|nr:hypothetical protein I317_03282 [Kwoniella heveanensis CBS 569]
MSDLPSPSISHSTSSDHLNHSSSCSSMSTRNPGPEQAALLQSARLKLSSMDQEAMKKMRSTMMEYPDSGSSKSNSPASLRFPLEHQPSTRELGPRRSTLSRQVLITPESVENEASAEGTDGRKESSSNIRSSRSSEMGPSRSASGSETSAIPSSDYVIAVLGHESVGKTTVIERALKTWGMSHPVRTHQAGGYTFQSSYSQIQPGGKLKQAWKVEFLEMNVYALDLSPQAKNLWPEGTPDNMAGVIFCYDATRSDTLAGLTEAIERLAASSIPMVILACKSDPGTPLEVDAPHGNQIGEPFNVGLIEVTTQTSEGKSKMRNAFRWLLYKLEQRQRRQQRKSVPPIPIPTASAFPSPSLASATLEALASPDSDSSSAADRIMWHQRGLNMTPADGDGVDTVSDHRSSGSSLGWVTKGPPPSTSIEPESKEGSEEVVHETKKPPTSLNGVIVDKAKLPPAVAGLDPPLYLSVKELLNKLFTAVVSSQDEPFVRAFFMTYRRFMLPRELMQEFSSRLEEVDNYAVSTDVKNWTMMKITGALVDWTTRYPGDLQDGQTQGHFKEILALILHHTFMAHLTGELIMIENSLSETVDVDQSWSLHTASPPSTSSRPSVIDSELVLDSEVLYEFDSSLDKSEPPTSMKERTHSARSVSTSSLALESDQQHRRKRSGSDPRLGAITTSIGSGSDDKLGGHSHGQAQAFDEMGYHRWAGAINMVISMDPRAFATELTRMQWELFTCIRPRDIFRHDFGKETNGPVGESIMFFNHISRWVSTLILAHPKAKHRARVIERFITISHQLRRLNNYDTLYALISGMREASVDRLASTHALVQVAPNIEKDFQSHLKLMDPRGGYVHYRRALQADISNGRASIPLLTTLLGLVNRLQAVRPDDRRKEDNKVQWDKFARFGEILGVINECQSRGPIVRGEVNDRFRRIIEDTPVISNEDGLWERSQLLEPSGGTVGGKVLKRLATLGFS